MTEQLYIQMSNIINTINIIVETLFPTFEVKASFVGQMSGTFNISHVLAVRLLWRQEYCNDKWMASEEQILQLVDIYLQNGWSWKGDKLLDKNSAFIPISIKNECT